MTAGGVLYSCRDGPYSWFLPRGLGDAVKDYILTLLVTAAVTYMLTPLVRRIAGRVGAIKEPRDRDVHVAPIPLLGGVAMYGGLVAGLLVADQIPQLRDGFANTGIVSGLLLAGGLLVVVGIVDDRWGLSPLTKAAGQVAAGGILVATGTQLTWLPLPGGSTFFPTPNERTVLTILIVVATINAVNFIDGLDGLAAGIVAIAAVSFFLYYYSMTRVIDISALAAPALASAILIGMCLGFLPHNFSPASIFMGDTGSMLLGLLLAYAPISGINSLDPAVLASNINRYPEIMPLLLPAALLVIPYGDLLLAVVRRTRAGRSPFAPDRKHLHHRLLDIGHSQRASVLIMYLWATVFSGLVVWLSIQRTEQRGGVSHRGQPVFVFVAITAAAVVALLLMSMPKLRWWGRASRLDEQSAKLAVATVPAHPATAVPDWAVPVEAELRPPAAAPAAAIGAAEPQLVAAAAVARMTPLAAPVPHAGSPAWVPPDRGVPEAGAPDYGVPDHGVPDLGVSDDRAPDAVTPQPSRADPPAAAWTFGDQRRSDHETLEWRPPNRVPAEAVPLDPLRRTNGYAPAHRMPAPDLPAPGHGAPAHSPTHAAHAGNGSAAARSIIGTPPPAVTSLEPPPPPAVDSYDLQRPQAGQAEL
jgi:UDP-GlcNAc:undecaprenyl-phosphate GlcNAc-1-phosphate transferase